MTTEVIDGYQLFFSEFIKDRKQEFFEFGLKNIIAADVDKARESWTDLKHRLKSDQPVFIRRYGRGGINSPLYEAFYTHVFNNNNIKPDPTNNAKPRQLLEQLTGFAKKPKGNLKPIQNFQVSHVFGRTKNALAFTAPWNIVYLPKLLDPFTGHEAKGAEVLEFTNLFQGKCIETFGELIQDFNEIMESDEVTSKLASGIDYVAVNNKLTEKQKQQFAESVYSEFEPIPLKINKNS